MEKMNDENQRMFDAYVTLHSLRYDIEGMATGSVSTSGIVAEIFRTETKILEALEKEGIKVELETEGATKISAYKDGEFLDMAEEGIDDYRW